jgi:hypothetical protein
MNNWRWNVIGTFIALIMIVGLYMNFDIVGNSPFSGGAHNRMNGAIFRLIQVAFGKERLYLVLILFIVILSLNAYREYLLQKKEKLLEKQIIYVRCVRVLYLVVVISLFLLIPLYLLIKNTN